jgi:hypothetical protein
MNDCQEKITVLQFGLDSSSHREKFFLKTMSYGDALHNLRQPNALVLTQAVLKLMCQFFVLTM